MKKSIRQLESKKILQEYLYLKTDFEYKHSLIDEYREDFLKIVNLNILEENTPSDQPTESKKPLCKIETSYEISKQIKKIYREIVKVTHPDKVESEALNRYYIEATSAYNINDLLELCLICEKLEIQIDFTSIDFTFLNKIIESKKNDIISIESSFIWLWINSKNETDRDMIIQLFISHCKNNLKK